MSETRNAPPQNHRRRWPLITALVVLALSGAYTAYWFWAANFFRNTIARFIDQRAAEGTAVSYATLEIGGFPFQIRATASDAKVAWADGRLWQAPLVTVGAPTWNPHTGSATMPTGQTITVPTPQGPVTVQIDQGQADFRLAHGGAFRAGTLQMNGILARGEHLNERLTAQTATVSAAVGEPVVSTDLNRHVSVTINGLSGLPGQGLQQETIQRLVVEADVLGPLSATPQPEDVAAWAAQGGVLQITQLALEWNQFSMIADGTFTLDDQFRPEGAASARVKGFDETIQALVKKKLLPPFAAVGIQAAVMTIGQRQQDGTMLLPLTLQNGVASMGAVQLGQVRPLQRW